MLKNFILFIVLMIISLSAFAVEPAVPAQSNILLYFTVVISCLFAISEALGSIPEIRSNGIFQMISSILSALAVKRNETIEKQKNRDKINSEENH